MIYDIHKSYAENAAQGPFFAEAIPKRPKKGKAIHFLGFEVSSPIGVPAGPLLNSRWIALAAKLGFDIPTYKTLRSCAHPGHPLPNVLPVRQTEPHRALLLSDTPESLSEPTITNSFGMPSKSPDFLLEDIAKANQSLAMGQLMIVSVVGTPNQGLSFADDFVRAAMLAKEAGAKVIEANFSCPNIDKAEGCLYMSHDAVHEYAKRIAQAIHPTPLLIKVGLFSTRETMEKVFTAAARAKVRGVCGLNGISMEVVDAHGRFAFGESRKTSGVCGSAIRPQALHFIREAAEINRKLKLDLTLLGCGGIVHPDHFDEFLHAGAQIAMSATGMMWDPFLALHYHEKKNP